MLSKSFYAGLAASLLCASGTMAADAQDCALKQIASLPITTTANNLLAVPLKINGTNRLFAVSLDSSITGVTGHFIDDQKLDTEVIPGHIMFSYIDKIFTEGEIGRITHQTTIADVQIGSADVKDMPMLDIPARATADDISGFLGTNVLKHFDVEFDFKNAKMNLYSQDHCPGKVVYWADAYAVAPLEVMVNSGHTVSQMALDGGTLNVGLSLTPGHGSIGLWLAAKATGIPIDAFKVNPVPAGPYLEKGAYRYPFKSLSVGGLALANPTIDVIESDLCADDVIRWPPAEGPWNLCAASMYVHRDELSKLHLYFAFAENKLYVTAADAHK